MGGCRDIKVSVLIFWFMPLMPGFRPGQTQQTSTQSKFHLAGRGLITWIITCCLPEYILIWKLDSRTGQQYNSRYLDIGVPTSGFNFMINISTLYLCKNVYLKGKRLKWQQKGKEQGTPLRFPFESSSIASKVHQQVAGSDVQQQPGLNLAFWHGM